MWWYLVNAALAGTVFHTDLGGALYELDTRSLASTTRIAGGLGVGGLTGLAYDPHLNQLWLHASAAPVDSLVRIDVGSWSTQFMGAEQVFDSALAFDPVQRMLVGVSMWGIVSLSGVRPYVPLANPGFDSYNADWFDDGGFIVARDTATSAFYGLAPPATPWLLAQPGRAYRASPSGLAYDKDNRLFWEFGRGYVVGMDPESFEGVVGIVSMTDFDGAAGSIDDVPGQAPEMYVTPSCPGGGLAQVTVVDATPGGRVQIGSGATLGSHPIRSGVCVGSTLGLRNPVSRGELVANSYGIATTTVTLAAGACGAMKIQAIDLDSCLVTPVRTVEGLVLP